LASGRSLSEWHTGMRAYTREVLESIDYPRFSDDFVFDTQVLFAVVQKGFSIGEIPVPVRYFQEASSISFGRSVRYGLLTVHETVKFLFRTNRVLRYIATGLLALLFNLSVYWILLNIRVWYPISAFAAFWSGTLVSFTLQKYWTFAKTQSNQLLKELLL